MATTTISGSGTRNDKGTIFGAGNVGGSKFRTLSQTANVTNISGFRFVQPSFKTGIESVLKGTAVAMVTAIQQSSSTGFVKLTKTSHGLSVGDLVVVYGSDVAAYNTVHRVTVVTSSSVVQTDVFYTSDTQSVHGSYKPFSGNFAKMTSGRYIGTVVGTHIAGSATSLMRITASEFFRVPVPVSRGNHRYNITGWNYVTGAATKGANAGDAIDFHDIAANNDSLGTEGFPSKAVPGEFVYYNGLKGGPVQADYKASTK